MTALFNRWLPGLTLAIWSLVLLHFAKAYGSFLQWIGAWTPLFTGRVEALLAPPFRPAMLAAGLVLLAMAIVLLLFPADAACCQASECGHPLSRFAAGKWLTFLVLVVPVVVSARFSPEGFSRNAMENRGIVTDAAALPAQSAARANVSDPLSLPLPQSDAGAPSASTPAPAQSTAAAKPAAAAPLSDYVQKTKEGYLEAEVLDLLYAAQDNTLRKVFEGKTVQLIGQLMPDPAAGPGGRRFKAVRMFMTCCAADARPVATIVEAAAPPELPEMTWIKVIGSASFPVENGRRTAVLKAERVEKTAPPDESMLY